MKLDRFMKNLITKNVDSLFLLLVNYNDYNGSLKCQANMKIIQTK